MPNIHILCINRYASINKIYRVSGKYQKLRWAVIETEYIYVCKMLDNIPNKTQSFIGLLCQYSEFNK